MLQKTFITQSSDELLDYMLEIRELPEYRRSANRIVLFSDQDNGRSHLLDRVQRIESVLPYVKVAGITMPKANMLSEFGTGFLGAGYSFLMLERSKVEVYAYDCTKISTTEAGKLFRREIHYKEHIAGVMVFSAGVEKEIDRFISTVADGDRSDIPIFGAQAGATGEALICCSELDGVISDRAVVAVVFSGRGLHLYYNYDMGWQAIGKKMYITETEGSYCIKSIDGKPAVSIYQNYLGVEPDAFFVDNVREFPLITNRGDRKVVRTPSGYDEKGNVHFIARVNEGDAVQLSYGNPRRLLEETKLYADSMRSFRPQALFLLVCENRVRFLGDLAASDIQAYRSFMPQMAWVRGFAAVCMDQFGGGIVNSAIISVGFREGAPRSGEISQSSVVIPDKTPQGAIPLDQRLAMFLERTTHELEEMAVAAEAASTAKSEFLSQMSHEIRTPINAVIGMNEMILRETDKESVSEYAENARVAGMNLLSIINDILDFSKIEAGKMEIVPYEYELASLVNDLVNLIQLRADEKGLVVHVRVNPDTPHLLFGDENRVKQIITNLLTNAVKYTEKGTIELFVDFEKRSGQEALLQVAVKDTGIGIRQGNLQKLFDAFERIDQERARKIEGTGLGINITQRLLNLMGSTLQVESTYGEGSTFSFELPQKVSDWSGIGEFHEAVKKVQSRRAERKEQFVAQNARILVVDDAPMNLAVISGLLKRTKIVVDTAESGAKCLELFGKKHYDLVFLDHMMPEMDGLETLAKLRELYGDGLCGVAVISLTANAVSGARELYLEAGFTDYLSKPVLAGDLEDMLLKHLPLDKVAYTEGGIEKEEQGEVALPAWLTEINLLHTDKGVEYCGGVPEYLDALSIFAASIDSRSAEMESCYLREDWENYTIKVHALKTMARSIGATELSQLAQGLEDAGRSEDTGALVAGHSVLLSLYRSLEEPLRPLVEEKQEKKQEKRPSGRSGRVVASSASEGKSILVVDDDGDFLRLAGRWLGKSYRVSTAGSGELALEYLKSNQPDLVLLDYAMPKMSGLEVLKRIREDERTKDLPVVFLTGMEDRESAMAAEKLNPQGFLLKSIASHLRPSISHLLRP